MFIHSINKNSDNILIPNNKNIKTTAFHYESNDNKTSITYQKYIDDISYYSKIFTETLNNYNLNTIMTKKENDSFTIYETSILIEDLNLPNGYKLTPINFDTNESMKTYISLVDTLKNNSWNRLLNINIKSDSSIFEFNEINYPEIFGLIKNLNANISTDILSKHINNIISSDNAYYSNEFFNIKKSNINNNTFLQMSIYLNNGKISEN